MLSKSIFSFEEETTAVERVLDKSGANDDKPLSLSAKILAQREKMVAEAEEQAKAMEEEEDNSSDDGDSDDSDDGASDDGDGDGDESGDDGDDFDDDEGDDDFDDDWDDEDDSDDDDDSEDEDDEESDEDEDEDIDSELDDEDEDKDKDDGKEKTSWESHKEVYNGDISLESIKPSTRLPKSKDPFRALRDIEKKKLRYLRSMGFSMEDVEKASEEGTDNIQSSAAVAFTKDAIIESIIGLGEINKKYLDNTQLFIDKVDKSLPKLDERLLNFQAVHDRGEIEFTNQMVKDVSLLVHLAYNKDINLREVLRTSKTFSKVSNDISKMIMNSPFKDLENIFLSVGFQPKGEILEYNKILPGFNKVAVNLPEFKSYIKTSPIEYQYYTLKENNPSDVYEINPVSITEEKDVDYYVETMKGIILDLSVSVDILKVLLVEFRKFMDSLKVIRVGVEEDEYERLNELGLDEKVQEFTMFKLVVEIMSTNINLSIEVLTAFMEVMDSSLKLTDMEPATSPSDDNSDEENDNSDEEEDDETDEGDSDDETDESDSDDEADDSWDDF